MMTVGAGLQAVSTVGLRYSLAANLIWIGALKFERYEVENIDPLVSSSPPMAGLQEKLGKKTLARIVGVTEIALGSLIAAKPFAPRASTVGSVGAVGMFATTLSFMVTTPGVSQDDHSGSRLSMVGQFLLKDSVLLAASVATAADSLQAAD